MNRLIGQVDAGQRYRCRHGGQYSRVVCLAKDEVYQRPAVVFQWLTGPQARSYIVASEWWFLARFDPSPEAAPEVPGPETAAETGPPPAKVAGWIPPTKAPAEGPA